MSELQDSWKSVISRVETLGQKLKVHLEQEAEEEAAAGEQPASTEAASGDTASDNTASDNTASSETASDDTATDGPAGTGEAGPSSSTRAAIEDLGQRIQEAIDSFGAAAKDPAVRADVKEIGLALKVAVTETLNTVTTEVGEVVKHRTGRGEGESQDEAAASEASRADSSTTDTTTDTTGDDDRPSD